MDGAKKISPKDIGSYAPGAVAEHLTSWSAEFQRPQTKCTEWLEAGVTATSGSVVEPNMQIRISFHQHVFLSTILPVVLY